MLVNVDGEAKHLEFSLRNFAVLRTGGINHKGARFAVPGAPSSWMSYFHATLEMPFMKATPTQIWQLSNHVLLGHRISMNHTCYCTKYVLFVSSDKVLLYGPGLPRTHYVAQVSLQTHYTYLRVALD